MTLDSPLAPSRGCVNPGPEERRRRAVAPVEMRVLLRLGGTAGLRAPEITDLKWGDVDLGGGALTVRNGGKTRRVLVSASLLANLRELGPPEENVPVIGRTPEADDRLKKHLRGT